MSKLLWNRWSIIYVAIRFEKYHVKPSTKLNERNGKGRKRKGRKNNLFPQKKPKMGKMKAASFFIFPSNYFPLVINEDPPQIIEISKKSRRKLAS